LNDIDSLILMVAKGKLHRCQNAIIIGGKTQVGQVAKYK
jgi:hypothetical protein